MPPPWAVCVLSSLASVSVLWGFSFIFLNHFLLTYNFSFFFFGLVITLFNKVSKIYTNG